MNRNFFSARALLASALGRTSARHRIGAQPHTFDRKTSVHCPQASGVPPAYGPPRLDYQPSTFKRISQIAIPAPAFEEREAFFDVDIAHLGHNALGMAMVVVTSSGLFSGSVQRIDKFFPAGTFGGQ
jgi:hypothetical protein